MADPFIGQISLFAGNFAPNGWAFCNGQLLAISSYSALFSLLGTTYGGNGMTTFGLPDLRGRVPMHAGTGTGLSTHQLGEQGGYETVMLNASQIPSHSHSLEASNSAGDSKTPQNNYPATADDGERNYSTGRDVSMASTGASGGGQSHPNMQPYLCINFIIALEGIYPSRS